MLRAVRALLRRALAAFAFAVRLAVFDFDFSRAAFRRARRFASASGLCFRLKHSIRLPGGQHRFGDPLEVPGLGLGELRALATGAG